MTVMRGRKNLAVLKNDLRKNEWSRKKSTFNTNFRMLLNRPAAREKTSPKNGPFFSKKY